MASSRFIFQADKRVWFSPLQAADSKLFFVFLLLTKIMLELPGFALFVILLFMGVKLLMMRYVIWLTYRCLMGNYIVTE